MNLIGIVRGIGKCRRMEGSGDLNFVFLLFCILFINNF